jgi:phospho-N-acetylmuramoyl-pentapeptide-transferase
MISLMTSGGVALLVAALLTPVLIGWLIKNNIGQQIREDGPQVHIAKAGTPTMGGIGIVVAVIIGYLAARAIPGTHVSPSGILVLLTVLGASVIGFADDWIKVRHRRSLGLNKRAKFGAQIALGLGFALLSVYWAHISTNLSFTRYNSLGIHLGTLLWVVWATVIIAATGSTGISASTTWATPWTWPSPRWPWPAPASASCGGTPPRRGSSWGTPGRCRSGRAWPRSAC